MARDIGTDDPRVRVRPGKSSRPRTKVRPDWSSKPLGQVIAIDRGRYAVLMQDGTHVFAVRARELGRGSIIIGDRVRLTGDLSGRTDTLGRIVCVEERTTVLRRSLEDAPDHRGEKAIVANAQTMVIVTALAAPPPRMGMIDRCLVAAHEAGLEPIVCLTKADLADPAPPHRGLPGLRPAFCRYRGRGVHAQPRYRRRLARTGRAQRTSRAPARSFFRARRSLRRR